MPDIGEKRTVGHETREWTGRGWALSRPDPPPQSALSKGMGGFAKTTPFNPMNWVRAFEHPVDTGAGIAMSAIADPATELVEAGKSAHDAFTGKGQDGRLISALQALKHTAGAIPFVGKALTGAGNTIGEGNVAEGVGELAGIGSSAFLPAAARGTVRTAGRIGVPALNMADAILENTSVLGSDVGKMYKAGKQAYKSGKVGGGAPALEVNPGSSVPENFAAENPTPRSFRSTEVPGSSFPETGTPDPWYGATKPLRKPGAPSPPRSATPPFQTGNFQDRPLYLQQAAMEGAQEPQVGIGEGRANTPVYSPQPRVPSPQELASAPRLNKTPERVPLEPHIEQVLQSLRQNDSPTNMTLPPAQQMTPGGGAGPEVFWKGEKPGPAAGAEYTSKRMTGAPSVTPQQYGEMLRGSATDVKNLPDAWKPFRTPSVEPDLFDQFQALEQPKEFEWPEAGGRFGMDSQGSTVRMGAPKVPVERPTFTNDDIYAKATGKGGRYDNAKDVITALRGVK